MKLGALVNISGVVAIKSVKEGELLLKCISDNEPDKYDYYRFAKITEYQYNNWRKKEND